MAARLVELLDNGKVFNEVWAAFANESEALRGQEAIAAFTNDVNDAIQSFCARVVMRDELGVVIAEAMAESHKGPLVRFEAATALAKAIPQVPRIEPCAVDSANPLVAEYRVIQFFETLAAGGLTMEMIERAIGIVIRKEAAHEN